MEKQYYIGKKLNKSMDTYMVSDVWVAYKAGVSVKTVSNWMNDVSSLKYYAVKGLEAVTKFKLI